MSEARPTLSAGATLAGRWQITDFIGRGELGEVYGVRDLHGGADAALKLFFAPALTRPEVWSAFQTAVRAVSAAGTEGVARASDFGIDANSGRSFYVSERVSWPSLAQLVATRGPLAPEALAQGLQVVARAIDAAHGAGVIHRHLKPENVFISGDNPSWARVTDFGTAILRGAAPSPPGSGSELGWQGPDAADPAQRPTPAMDIFGLGLVCFFALTGRSPFLALRSTPIDANLLWRELAQPLGALSSRARELGVTLDPSLDPWFARALAPAPSDRFAKASELAEAFATIVGGTRPGPHTAPDALPGIAAAIPQPLVFQPEPPKRAPEPAPAPALRSAPSGAVEADDIPGLPGRKQGRLTTQLFVGGAVLCFALTAAGAYALYRVRSGDANPAESAPSSSAPARIENPPAPAAPASAPAEPSEPPQTVAKARFQCVPGPCEWVVCDGKNIRGLDKEVELAPGEHACSASRYGSGSKALIFTAKVGETSEVVFELPPLPVGAAKKAVVAPPPASAKAAPARSPAKKSDGKSTAKSGSTKSGTKKKCGTFINPCK